MPISLISSSSSSFAKKYRQKQEDENLKGFQQILNATKQLNKTSAKETRRKAIIAKSTYT